MTEDEELFIAEKDSRQNYTEQIQYVTVTHTTKAEGRQNKQDAASGRGTARFATAAFSFDELVDYHAKGMTFRKLPESAIDGWSTRFLVMDFDNKAMPDHDPVNVTKQELEQIIDMCQLTARYTHSGDCLDCHWHLFILLDEPVKTADEYTEVRDHTEERLNTALAFIRGRAKLPRLTDPKLYAQTTVFAPKQATARRIVKKTWYVDQDGKLAWGEPPEHLERTIDFPMPRTQVEAIDSAYLIPLRLPDFARWLVARNLIREERVEDFEYNFYVPSLKYMQPGGSKATKPILEGSRDNCVYRFMRQLYNQYRSYNLWLHDHGFDDYRFTDYDVQTSLELYVKDAFIVGHGTSFEKFDKQLRKLCKKNRKIPDREYCELQAKYTVDRHEGKTRNYLKDAAYKIIEFYKQGDTVKFGSVQERDNILKNKSISIATLRKEAMKYGLKVVAGSRGGKRVGAGRKPSEQSKQSEQAVTSDNRGRGRPSVVTLDTLSEKGQLKDNILYWTVKLSPTERKFCSLRNIKIKKDDSVKKTKKNKSVKNNSEEIVNKKNITSLHTLPPVYPFHF